eukprot:1276537-Rhodomonas_salina.2
MSISPSWSQRQPPTTAGSDPWTRLPAPRSIPRQPSRPSRCVLHLSRPASHSLRPTLARYGRRCLRPGAFRGAKRPPSAPRLHGLASTPSRPQPPGPRAEWSNRRAGHRYCSRASRRLGCRPRTAPPRCGPAARSAGRHSPHPTHAPSCPTTHSRVRRAAPTPPTKPGTTMQNHIRQWF